MSDTAPKISALEAKHELWRRGVLSWKLDENQKDLYRLFHDSDHKIQTWLLARRSGKTYTLIVLALEMCLRKPRSVVKFIAPTKLQVRNIIRPLIGQITEDCPKDISPVLKTQDDIYYFPNGSEFQLAGSDSGNAEKLRGGSSDIAIIDETQDVDDLGNIIKSVLLPTTLTTRGKILIAGTPPKETDHEFVTYIEDAEEKGSLIKRTIYDNPRLTAEDIEDILSQYALREKSEEFRREFLCEIIKDQNISVIPEFTEDLKKQIVKEWPKPPYFDTYVSMDLGAVDLTGVLFGYYDFRGAKIVIEDELVLDFSKADVNIGSLTDAIAKKEESLWTNPISGDFKKPLVRVSDINPIVTQEIAVKSHGKVAFMPAKKDDKEAAINNMRALIGAKKIIIHPRCVNLIRHLDHVKWSSGKNRNNFARSQDNGHYDLVDALIYLCRAVVYSKNPYPANYDLGGTNYFDPDPSRRQYGNNAKSVEVYKKIFGIKGK